MDACEGGGSLLDCLICEGVGLTMPWRAPSTSMYMYHQGLSLPSSFASVSMKSNLLKICSDFLLSHSVPIDPSQQVGALPVGGLSAACTEVYCEDELQTSWICLSSTPSFSPLSAAFCRLT